MYISLSNVILIFSIVYHSIAGMSGHTQIAGRRKLAALTKGRRKLKTRNENGQKKIRRQQGKRINKQTNKCSSQHGGYRRKEKEEGRKEAKT